MATNMADSQPGVSSGFFSESLADRDPELYQSIRGELGRLQGQVELIASENVVSKAVLEATGSVMTNKYAEGYPGRRYYGGCEYVDVAEELARERAKKLFDCAYVNVQPHAGAQANLGVYVALCQPGDTILGMSLAAQRSTSRKSSWPGARPIRGLSISPGFAPLPTRWAPI